MTQMAVSRARAHALALVVAALVGVGLLGACAETRRSLGEACLKDQDCLSGICSQLVCGAEPPLTDAEAVAEVGATGDGGAGDAADGSASDAPAETAADSGGSGEAASDAGGG